MKAVCADMQDYIADLVSGVLPEEEAKRLRDHISVCPGCRDYLTELENEDRRLSKAFEYLQQRKVGGMVKVLEEIKSGKIQTQPIPLWRRIMKSRITQFASAAVLAITAGLMIIMLEKSASPVYAFEQTIEAVKKVTKIHVIGRDWQGGKIEQWIKLDTYGSMEYCTMDRPGLNLWTVSTPEKSYIYNKKDNTVRVMDCPAITSYLRLGAFCEAVNQVVRNLKGIVTSEEIFDPVRQKKVIVMKITSYLMDIEIRVDPSTKLPMSIHIVRTILGNSDELFKDVDEISYTDEFPAGIFEFKIPAGAKIIMETAAPIASADQVFPRAVIQWIFAFNANSISQAKLSSDICPRALVYRVDRDMVLTRGGICPYQNNTGKTLTGEVKLFTTTDFRLDMFDTAGRKLNVRYARDQEPNTYGIFVTPEISIKPKETQYYLGIMRPTEPLCKDPSGKVYPVHIRNYPGQEIMQNFILVIPTGIRIATQSEKILDHKRIGAFDVYVWQKHITGNDGFVVDVGLVRQE